MLARFSALASLAGFSAVAFDPGAARAQEGLQVVYTREPGAAAASSVIAGEDGTLHVLSRRGGIGSWKAFGEPTFEEPDPHPLVRALEPGEAFVFSPSRRSLGVVDHPLKNERVTTRVRVLVDGIERTVSLAGAHSVQLSDDGKRVLFFEYGHDAASPLTLRVQDLEGGAGPPVEIVSPAGGIVRFSGDATVIGVRRKEGVAVYRAGDLLHVFPSCLGFFISSDGSLLAAGQEESVAFFSLGGESPRGLTPLDVEGRLVTVAFSEQNLALVLTRSAAWLHAPREDAAPARHLASPPPGQRFTSGAFLREPREGEAAVALGSRRVIAPPLDLEGLHRMTAEALPGRALAEVTLLGLDGRTVAREAFELTSWAFDEPRVRPLPLAGVFVLTPDRVLAALPSR